MSAGESRDGGLDLSAFRFSLSPLGILVAARRIGIGDEDAFADASAKNLTRRRASGAARIAARGLLGELGSDPFAPLPRSPSRAPVWPKGVVGSLAHDDVFAVAAVASARQVVALGIDIEPADPLPDDIAAFALSDAERLSTHGDPVTARLIFSCKEAVYKAVNPFDGSPLEYDDIEIRLAEERAALADGREVKIIVERGARLLVVALF
jgi:4'-phosphopantetheinyl transferase EntD